MGSFSRVESELSTELGEVHMFGSFEFSDEDSDIDLEALAAQYADAVFWSNATQPGQGDLFD
jgi:hypothetical protein